MKKTIITLMVGIFLGVQAQAVCSDPNGTGGFDGTTVTGSQLGSNGTSLWISGTDSGWGATQVIIDASYSPPLEVLLSCIDAARKAQMNPTTLKVTVSGTHTMIPNVWGGSSCGFNITAGLSCNLVNR